MKLLVNIKYMEKKEKKCKVCGHNLKHHYKDEDCGEENSCRECEEYEAIYGD